MGCTVLLALVSFTLMMCGDEASADTEGDLTYDVELGSAVITGTTLSSPSELTIPETLGGYPVAGIRDGAFSSCPYITAFALSGTSTVFSPKVAIRGSTLSMSAVQVAAELLSSPPRMGKSRCCADMV